MGTPFEDMADMDRLVHEPARLAITSALLSCESADFLFLQRITGLSKGNLSSHLSKLAAAEVVEVHKSGDGRPRTTVRLTGRGRTLVADHWDRLMRLHEAARTWTAPDA
ncbi:transcriptional regulator [Nocardiopsis aegyptia]|uniref:DNA-binding transcriptional ArsR family regulator n=1 Tax=Nocardiopsis aegyptia TaxID=220378 RepID=A0A7Z0JCK8_9ACTN|nr:transcriptional regulator [Nocardiopsis aegyptia]NYJ36574.1 DNA-binding transcriptional ArsR family regulator [Nocardiopsis aegyptia]